jgi:hypothetical protein
MRNFLGIFCIAWYLVNILYNFFRNIICVIDAVKCLFEKIVADLTHDSLQQFDLNNNFRIWHPKRKNMFLGSEF